MSKPVIAVGGAMFFMGVVIATFPEQFVSFVEWESRTGQYSAAAIRLVTGMIFILGAPGTRYPTGFRIFGGLVLLAGIIIIFTPSELWAALVGWLMYENPMVMRIGAGVGGTLIGAFIVYAAKSERSDDQDRHG